MSTPFVNEPFSNFGDPAVAAKMRAALDRVRSELGREYPLVIGGEKVSTSSRISSINPSDPDVVVGRVAQGTRKQAEQALNVALETFASWRTVSAEERASYLFKAAKIIRDRKFDYAAWMVLEVGKSWVEADADTAEAIDFLEYYGARDAAAARVQPVTPIPGEENEVVLHSARRRRGDPAVELPAGDLRGHDDGRDGGRQHGRAQAGQRRARHRRRSSSR